ncbi:hypothetical protein CBR_g38216 [Chara braunii]|uniref:HMG box domain-containing protein n=1 Tax=Chara braunii TaxID=69332 RepID=A0A388LPT4_CHABU|nr:hypothetical protein CBR_g38216 [Chara braunii]|eukprot:GBG84245.1 hypothetical protein CBR_g38216 [Chara braunii]
MFFCKDHRDVVKSEHPDVSFGEIGKILGQQWSNMSEKEKKPYLKKAEDDKKRYQDEMASYEPEGSD